MLNDQAGLIDAMMVPCAELTILGERSADPVELRIKAEADTFDERTFVFHSDRV